MELLDNKIEVGYSYRNKVLKGYKMNNLSSHISGDVGNWQQDETPSSNEKKQTMNTSFSYMYRDAGNWKQHEDIILAGAITEEDIEVIISKLEFDELFLPAQVGLEPLQQRWGNLNDDDHVWHELYREDIELTKDEPTVEMTVEELVANFKSVDGWDVRKAFDKLWGICP